MGKWAKRPGGETTRGERESGRNDSGANGKVGETTRIPNVYAFQSLCTIRDLTYKPNRNQNRIESESGEYSKRDTNISVSH